MHPLSPWERARVRAIFENPPHPTLSSTTRGGEGGLFRISLNHPDKTFL